MPVLSLGNPSTDLAPAATDLSRSGAASSTLTIPTLLEWQLARREAAADSIFAGPSTDNKGGPLPQWHTSPEPAGHGHSTLKRKRPEDDIVQDGHSEATAFVLEDDDA
jgi:hypothetical protein